jgi:hypothetical protein
MRRDKRLLGKTRSMESNGGNNRFSANFLSLQLQLKTLLEEAGGDELMPFLDALGTMNRSEQKIILKVLTRTIEKVATKTPRLATDGDLALKEFEDSLFADLAQALETGETKSPTRPRKIEVLSGGKASPEPEKTPIDLAAARKRKRISSDTILN